MAAKYKGLPGEYYYKKEPDAEKAREAAEEKGYPATLSKWGNVWRLTVTEATPQLSKAEQKEWLSLQAKSESHGIPIKRVGPANVHFGGDVYAQLGTGRATSIMDARVELKKRPKTPKRPMLRR